MRKLVVSLTILFFTTLLSANIAMRLEMPRQRYMTYEPVIAGLTLCNNSGQVLIFGTEAEFQGFLEIGLFDMHNRPLKGSGTKISLKGLILRPGADQQIRINIGKWLDMRRAGYYKLKVYISHPMLKNEYESNFCTFDITAGQVFWQRSFGIPNLQGAQLGSDLKQRSYIIKTLQNNSEIHFFLFVEDANKVYAVKYLGQLLGREVPFCELDSLNQLHILLPVASRKFKYMLYDWHGNEEKHAFYRTGRTVPMLHRQSTTGDVNVVGGELIHSDSSMSSPRLLPDLPADAGLQLNRSTKKPSAPRRANGR